MKSSAPLPGLTDSPRSLPDVVGDNPCPPYTLAQARADARRAGEGYSTGFRELDATELRWQPGAVYAIAGRPGEGKTATLLEILMRHVEQRAAASSDDHAPAAFVSYEQNLRALYLRLLLRQVAAECAAAGWSPPKRPTIQKWFLEQPLTGDSNAAKHTAIIEHAAATLDAHGTEGRLALIDGDKKGGTIDKVIEQLREVADYAAKPSSLVLIDYYQKIRPLEDDRHASRQVQLQSIADQLRTFAKGEGPNVGEVPVIVAAQVTRESLAVTVRRDEEPEPPELHHIREADDLANDAAGVVTLRKIENGDERDDSPARLLVAVRKNRNGRLGRLELRLNGCYSRVEG